MLEILNGCADLEETDVPTVLEEFKVIVSMRPYDFWDKIKN